MKKIVTVSAILALFLGSFSFAETPEPVKQTIKVINRQILDQSVGANVWVDGGLYISESKTELSQPNALSKLASKNSNTFTIQTDDPRKTNRSDWFGNIHLRLYAYHLSQNNCYQEASIDIPAKIENNKIVLQSNEGGYSIHQDQIYFSNDRCSGATITTFIVTVNGNENSGYELNVFGLRGR